MTSATWGMPSSTLLRVVRSVAAVVVLGRLARGRKRHPPLAPPAQRQPTSVTVVIPARDEADRIGPCLAALTTDPDVFEVVVVDDCSTDATAHVAAAHGARVIPGTEPDEGWVGKPWALQQGLEAASGEVVVSLDADTRPLPGLIRALVSALGAGDGLVTAGARFICDTPGERLLHPAMLATLVYRFGPSDADGRPPAPSRVVSNGQCTAVRREQLLAAGGYRAAAGHMTDDAALARALARRGWRIAFRDGSDLLEVDMHDSARDVWREWGRSIALPDVTSPGWRLADVAVVWLTLGLPPLRLVTGRADRLDLVLLAVRAAMLGPLARAYRRRGIPYWASPVADPLAALALTRSALRPRRSWRGRTYVR